MKDINKQAINALRVLSVDAVQKANSGHPGMPLGAAPIVYSLWANNMKFNVKDSNWINRDRFILSAGHASAMLYSLLHVFGYDVSIEDLKNFRQLNSKTPGHPEFGHTHGVEATTGPLGAGLATGVGLAMAQAHLAAKCNKPGYDLIDNYTFVLGGDGCMMEGISSEASSLAGTLSLGRLIVLYDSNSITIEGSTDLAFKENVRARYEAYGFETFLVEDGNDVEAIDAAIKKAKANLSQPSFIEIRTKIGFGSAREGSESAHGAPLGLDNVSELKNFLEYPSQEPFYVSEEVYDHYKQMANNASKSYDNWVSMFQTYRSEYPELAQNWDKDFADISLEELLEDDSLFEFENKPMATRNVSGTMINRLKDKYSNLFGGSADLAHSNMTEMHGESSFSAENYAGRNIHFGVREHAMAAIGNGITLYGGLKSYVSTFFVFTDFLKPMARLSSIMNLPLTYVLTHDSIGVGEDGPTHEPIEQLSMLRAQPNFITFRPADARETAYGWAYALSSKTSPVGLILSRQNLPALEMSGKDALKGAYVVYEPEHMDALIIATGSEVSLSVETAKTLKEEGIGVRVVSMPSFELFEMQEDSYKESILPKSMRKRVAVEAGSSISWGKYVGLDGAVLGLDTYGASGPGNQLFEHFGFTVENLSKIVKEII